MRVPAAPPVVAVPEREAGAPGGAGRAARISDLRRRAVRGPWRLCFAAGDIVVVSGLPGSGKSTLIRRAVPGPRIDSQDTRDRFSRRMPRFLPYALYRPLVRLAHYARLRRTLRAGTCTGLVVHDCGNQAWVRRWLAREAGRRARTLHLLLLDVPPEVARAGQDERGRAVSRYAFVRHRRAMARLMRTVSAGHLPPGCASAVLLDRPAANALRTIGFAGATCAARRGVPRPRDAAGDGPCAGPCATLGCEPGAPSPP